MDLHVWLAYLVAAIAIAVSPGPGAVLSMSHGMAYGVRKTSATIGGLEAGLAIILLIAGAGIGALLLASERAFFVVKVLGAAYLLWLGIKQWRAPVQDDLAATNGAGWTDLSAAQRFWRGLLVNATNPKGIVFMVAVLPQFIRADHPLLLQLMILLATTLAVDVTVMHGYALLASSLRRWVASVRAQRLRNHVAGGILIAIGASLAFVGRVARM